MYTSFYGLREKPFSLSPDPRFLFFADAHREALAHLRYGIAQNEGFMAITGEVGTGKTTICRTLLHRLGDDTEVAFLFNPARSATELLQSIAHELGLVPAGRQRHALNEQLNRFLLEKKREGKRVLLIIDEAQNLDADVLEEVRLLSNLETASSKLIQILLLGQPELDRKLDSDELRQLRQRISVRWHLMPLTRSETREYVNHRLEVAAGAERDVFTKGALRDIHRLTGGVPRRINLLCDRSLLAGYGAGAHRIGRRLVRKVARELACVGAQSARMSPAPRRARPRRLAATAVMAGVAIAVGLGAANYTRIHTLVSARHGPESLSAAVSLLDPQAPGVQRTSTTTTELAPPPNVDAAPLEHAISILDLPSGIEYPVEFELDGVTSEVGSELDDGFSDATSPVPLPEPSLAAPVDRDLDTIAPGVFLGRLLDAQDPASGHTLVSNAILDAYELPPYLEGPEDVDALFAGFEQRGLALLELSDVDLDDLRILNYPALLVLYGEQGDARLVALSSLDREYGTLYGVVDAKGLRVPVNEIEQQWEGEAVVVWEAYERLPELIVLGQRGRGVSWVQNALGELGYYGGKVTGEFDRATQLAVERLQQTRSIEVDGAVGPRTQMVLYDLLRRYPVPRLDEREDAG